MTEEKAEQNKRAFSRRKFLKVTAGGALSLSLLKGKTASSRESHQPQTHLEKIRIANVSKDAEIQVQQQELKQDIRVSSLAIPSIGIRDLKVGEAEFNVGKWQWETPDFGAVTPQEVIWPNISLVYGHISFGGKDGVFKNLPKVNIGDEIIVGGKDLNKGRVMNNGEIEYPETGKLDYDVADMFVTDISTFAHLINEMGANGGPKVPTLLIQTSIRESGSVNWLTDRTKLLEKARVQIDTNIDNPENYLIEVVVGKRKLE